MASRTPSIVDLNAELANLTMFRGRTPQTTFADRRGSAAQLAPFRDGALILSKSAGKGHWETHPGDELVYVLDGAFLEIVEKDGPQSFALGAGMMAIVPQGAWHRVHSPVSISISMSTTRGQSIASRHEAWRLDASSRH